MSQIRETISPSLPLGKGEVSQIREAISPKPPPSLSPDSTLNAAFQLNAGFSIRLEYSVDPDEMPDLDLHLQCFKKRYI